MPALGAFEGAHVIARRVRFNASYQQVPIAPGAGKPLDQMLDLDRRPCRLGQRMHGDFPRALFRRAQNSDVIASQVGRSLIPLGEAMRRRDLIKIIAASALWPAASHSEQSGPTARIGLLMMYPENDPQGQLRATVFRRESEDRLEHRR